MATAQADADNAAAPLDQLLVGVGAGPLRRWLPGRPGVEFIASLAGKPGKVADPAWTHNLADLKQPVEWVQALAGSRQLDWPQAVARSHTKFVTDLVSMYANAIRSGLSGQPDWSAMTIQLNKPADLLGMVGQEIGTGEWHAITQHQVNIFADATHDHQWIHVEPERAAKGPYGGPIAHGYLTLSFCPVFLDDVLKIDAVTAAVNYGVNKVRFPAPVPVGSRIRGHVRLVSAEQKQAGLECAFGILVELEGSDRPACVIETLVIYR